MTNAAQTHETLAIERIYPNCRAHVWSAWAVFEKKKAWFGEGLIELDFRPGGSERSAFVTEMGTHTNETRYFEIKDQERIVFAYSMALNGRVHTVSLTTVVFTDLNGGTRLTYTEQMCVIPPSDGAKGRQHGWIALLDAMENYLAEDTRRVSAEKRTASSAIPS
jgi:uncharacterized protein YndB with AHSA1/START domain